MNATNRPLLRPAWFAAPVLHGLFIASVLWLNFAAAGGIGNLANAARESAGLAILCAATGMLVTIPLFIALLSWWLCRRRNWTPFNGHMGLTIGAAALIVISS